MSWWGLHHKGRQGHIGALELCPASASWPERLQERGGPCRNTVQLGELTFPDFKNHYQTRVIKIGELMKGWTVITVEHNRECRNILTHA